MADIDIALLQKKAREVKNPELLAVFKELKESENPTEELHRRYAATITTASFIVPVNIKNVEQDGRVTMDISHLKNKQGDAFFMAFTDYETLLKDVKSNVDKLQIIGLTFGDLVKMLEEENCPMKGIAINPFTDNIAIGPAQAHAITTLAIQMKVESGEMAVINELPDIPFEITAPIERYFDRCGKVKKAYLMSLKRKDEKQKLIIVDLVDGVDFSEFAKDFADGVLNEIEDEKEPFMVMPITEQAAAISVKEKVPFYVKL